MHLKPFETSRHVLVTGLVTRSTQTSAAIHGDAIRCMAHISAYTDGRSRFTDLLARMLLTLVLPVRVGPA